ncbi:flippase [Candidatus Uhrbacteria bacterium]|nr:flippase [Candidatus Uhrbacteria bacterium]
MSSGQTVTKNATQLMFAMVAQKALAFLTFTIVARLVGAEIVGKFFYAVSITSIFVILTDIGLTPVVIRELSQNESRGKLFLSQAFRLKFLLIPIAILVSLGYAALNGASPEIFIAVLLACFVMSADAMSLLWYGALRGARKLKFEAVGLLVGQILTAIVSILFASLHGGVWGLVVGLLAGSTWNVAWSITRARKMGIEFIASKDHVRPLLISAIPFALAGFFVKVYSYVDTLLLERFHPDAVVGHYAVAYKLTYAFQFVPLAVVAALYPGLSAAHAANDRKAIDQLLLGSFRFMLIVSVPIAVGLSAFAPHLIPLVYGKDFLGSVLPLMILSWVLIPIFLDFPIGSLLNATHRARLKTQTMGFTMVINLLFNILLVPKYGPMGAAISGLISFWCLFFFGIWYARKDLASQKITFATLVARGLLIAGILWIGVRLLDPILAWPMVLALYIVATPLLLFSFQVLRWEDLKKLVSL